MTVTASSWKFTTIEIAVTNVPISVECESVAGGPAIRSRTELNSLPRIAGEMMDEAFLNQVGGNRISSRQIDELIGIARGVAADGVLNHAEVEFLQKWLAANAGISGQPVVRTLYGRSVAPQ